jgi:hypothetical protein
MNKRSHSLSSSSARLHLTGCGKRVPDPRKSPLGKRRINNLPGGFQPQKGFCRKLRCRSDSKTVTQLQRCIGNNVFECTSESAGRLCAAPAPRVAKPFRRFITICAWCNKLIDSEGRWQQPVTAFQADRGAKVSHGICPECAEKSYNAYQEMGALGLTRFSFRFGSHAKVRHPELDSECALETGAIS